MPGHKSDPHFSHAFQLLTSGFEDFVRAFATITQRASQRFDQRDWPGMRRDTLERLDLHAKVVNETTGLLSRALGKRRHSRALWTAMKTHYDAFGLQRCDAELACTFFNSVNRKLFNTVGIDPELTFETPPDVALYKSMDPDLTQHYPLNSISPEAIQHILTSYGFQSPWIDLAADAKQCALRIERKLYQLGNRKDPLTIDMVRSPFFRGMSVYLVGRLHIRDRCMPLVFAIDNQRMGLRVDALLTNTESLRILFSFSRAYFHVRANCPSALVDFLRPLMPEKRLAEIYIGLGYHKHGKTELYRDLLTHQKVCSEDRFDFSPGKRGMVMIAFNMPGDDIIYKVIRDRFDTPKKTTAREVMNRYDYVFKHDRAGRLVDVQTFENLQLDDCCFTPRLLSEIAKQAQKAVRLKSSKVILQHAYVERRVTPLDIYLQQADTRQAESAVLDYGQAIKDLAQVNVFPGDLLLKNFGVTSLGRVVFYDYDELCPLTMCNFRRMPVAPTYDDALNDEPWFQVGPHDVFPEEFASFLGLTPDLRKFFLNHHADLLSVAFWEHAQTQIQDGKWTHVRPYSLRERLSHG